MNHYAGMDLHSNNTVVVIIDDEEKCVFKRKFKNDLIDIKRSLYPFKSTLAGVVIEATYNWYWLVDGLMDAGYKVHLAHPAKIEGPKGIKYSNDYTDAFHLGHLLRTNNLPEAYIYLKEMRTLRDLLRKRSILVKKRTDFILSLINFANRNTGNSISVGELNNYVECDLREDSGDEMLYLSGRTSLECVRFLDVQIARLEKIVLILTQSTPYYKKLVTVPGIGKILALPITLETGDIVRFKDSGNFVSYCRGVGAQHTSNDKIKSRANRKSGNQYLAWAFVEAANFAKRYCPGAKQFFEHKLKQRRISAIATKALASKLARACFYLMRDNTTFQPERLFNIPKSITKAAVTAKPKRGLISLNGLNG